MSAVIMAALSGVASAVGSVIMKMLMGVLTNKQFIEDAFLYMADKLVKHTATDVDDKLLDLAKQALAHADAKSAEDAPK